MMMVGRMMRHIEARTLIISGLSITCASLYYMTATGPTRPARTRSW